MTLTRVHVACLATSTPDRPQLLVPKMRVEIYIGVDDALSLLYCAELVKTLPTGGMGGAAGNAGAVQFANGLGAVVNYGFNNVTQLQRDGNCIGVAGTFWLAPNCVNPVSVALSNWHAFVVGAYCAESRAWPSGRLDGTVVAIPDTSAGQIVVGESWAAVTLKSGSVLQLPHGWTLVSRGFGLVPISVAGRVGRDTFRRPPRFLP
jgi:hypothetical protein